ncbi:secretin N-terminal domain-containing protein [Coralloluteibacterium stylophorae]|uniref:NolW-like domain-containing protein n=1 Tax=Coralloluteibacterium stylophorae TaxID=1776034 RepID=A0A8J7VW46_9GAMM|nr:secretin N-terminal domain-containing protein [Coralloluteibacterium stylophorae]MBS7457837.1 hypothetical protein [Coralloluteibacterium stylophorae]
MSTARLRTFALSCILVLLAGCASTNEPVKLDPPLPVSPRRIIDPSELQLSGGVTPRQGLQETSTPTSPTSPTSASGMDARDETPPLTGPLITLNIDGMPVPAFVNEVFGNLLQLNFRMAQNVSSLDELVTLRTTQPQPPREIYRIARQVLAEYGVEVVLAGDLVELRVAEKGTSLEPPLIVSGRALPDVPVSHRPVYQLVDLEVIRAGEAARWINSIFQKQVTVEENTLRNAVLISGRPSDVRQAIDALRVIDRPAMRGRISTRLEPAFISATELATRLVQVLNVQGYGASDNLAAASSVIVIPVPSVNAVLVFAASRDSLNFTVQWARDLDRPSQTDGSNAIFYYPVQNTQASDLARVLGGQVSGGSRRASQPADVASGTPTNAERAVGTTSPSVSTGTIVVDEPRNALIFQGEAREWERLLPLIRQMDTAPRQVLIEVTIAEVTLDDNDDFGVAWFAKAGFGRFDGRLTSGSLTPSDDAPSGGLSYLIDVAGQNRAALRAFAQDSRVSILSTPRILVKSGDEANIDVGTEVPTITAQTTSDQTTGGTSNLLQSIQYRKTGIILNVKPTVYSNDRVDLELSQEVSEALPLGADESGVNSPSIFNRTVNTSLTLRDGGSVVLGGLMSSRQTNSDTGVPLLKDVPVLGNLFKSQSRRNNKTELVVMIVPYIIESADRAREVSQLIGEQLELLEMPASLEVPERVDAPAPVVVPQGEIPPAPAVAD